MANFQNPSGTSDHTETRDLIITRALRICSAIGDEEIPTPSMIANGSQALNDLVKQWDTLGIHVWTETEGVIFPQPGQYMYRLDPRSSPDHAAENWILGHLTVDMVQYETNVYLGTEFTNFGLYDVVIGDHIGIVLDSGRVYWALVAFPFTEVGTHIEIDIGIPTGESATGNKPVFLYRDKISQPLRVPSSRRFLVQSQIENSMLTLSRIDYREMPNKTTRGTFTSYMYDPQLITGFYYCWPAPSDALSLIRFTWYRRLNDFTDSNNTPDLPQEWSNALTWNLAKEIGPEYDIPLQKYQTIILQRAAETLDMVQGFDREPEPTYFGCAFTPSSR